jgi:cell division protein FtsZ
VRTVKECWLILIDWKYLMSEILMVGVGGAGCDIARHVLMSTRYDVVAVNTDLIGKNSTSFSSRLLIGPQVCKGGSAHTPERGRRAAEESHKELESMMSGSQILVLLAGLGGGAGSGASPAIVRIARDMGLNVFAAVTLPFSFERSRRLVALESLHRIRELGVPVFVHDHAVTEDRVGFFEMTLDDVLQKSGGAIANHVSCRLNTLQPQPL